MSSEPEAKRQRMVRPQKIIGTHDGTFHCDEALAVFLLRQTKLYADAEVVRTRDPEVLRQCTVVVDVGAVYDAHTQRFDHHQKEFEECFGYGFTTKLSSAGLVYKHFGQEIIKQRFHFSKDDPKLSVLWLKLYKDFIEGIDAIDNGIPQYPVDAKPAYRLQTDLSSRVGWLNPAWNETYDNDTLDSRFLDASAMAGSEFIGRLDYYVNAWLPSRDLVLEAFRQRSSVDASGRIILFERFAPWKEHLFDLEKERATENEPQTYYVLYPDEAYSSWRIQAVPQSPESFLSRKALPSSWRGLRDDNLSKECGVASSIFVHSSGFIGGNKSKEGALEMARLALKV